MTRRISLALAIHNHQPVGNFGWVFAEVFEHAYEPMVAALERHPGVRLALHYSGPLLEWLRAEQPAFIDRLRALAARDQVEIVGGGYFEPVLASLPQRDRLGQGRRMGDELERLFGQRPRGAWLAERVWEPDLPSSLVGAGYAWTILDDAHFRAAAVPEEGLWGSYTTEDQGDVLGVFATEQGLRYRIPFREVDEVIDYLRKHASEDGTGVGMMGDDGEKFGAWPTTWEHCWGEGRWVERFFDAIEANADWLSTTTPSAWLAAHPPIGRVYVPTGSYTEMGEWALPPEESRLYGEVLLAAQVAHRPEARWLRGATWRNFQVKYREVNDLHKQMLRTSAAVDAMPAGGARERALDHLYRGQCNDPYWHGLFGGVYIADVRVAAYRALIAAEDFADGAAGTRHRAETLDLDLDGLDDVRLAAPGQVVTVDLAEGAGIGGWDVRAVRHALGAVLRRRPEAYHDAVREADAEMVAAARNEAGRPVSIHERRVLKQAGLAAQLHYDPYERRSGLVRFVSPGTSAADWAAARAVELGDAVNGAFEVESIELDRLVVVREATVAGAEAASVHITKELVLGGDRRSPTLALTVTVANRSRIAVEAVLGVEWTLMLLGGGANPAAWWEVAGERTSHDSAGTATGITTLAQGNDDLGIAVATSVSEAADAWWAPVETVSNSEAGFERVYQGAGLLLSWPLSLRPGKTRSVTVTHTVSTAADRADDEIRGMGRRIRPVKRTVTMAARPSAT
jgi:alpha-amylase/alpha-mannosidase (GH57 family)